MGFIMIIKNITEQTLPLATNILPLKKNNVFSIKIDKSFVDEILEKKQTNLLIDAIIAMAKALNIETIAEGVETKEQFESIRDKGCDNIQGYYFSKPIPQDEFIMLVKKQN